MRLYNIHNICIQHIQTRWLHLAGNPLKPNSAASKVSGRLPRFLMHPWELQQLPVLLVQRFESLALAMHREVPGLSSTGAVVKLWEGNHLPEFIIQHKITC